MKPVGLPIADRQTAYFRFAAGDKGNGKLAFGDRQSRNPPATGWWY
jgi:hypothetical protein